MKFSILFAFTLLITLQLASTAPGSRLLKGKWIFSRFLEFNHSACCAFRNLTFTPDPDPYSDYIFANFVFDSRFPNTCQSLFGGYPNGFKIFTLGNLDYCASSSTRYIPNGDKSETTVRTDYTVMNGTETLVVYAELFDRLKLPQTILCAYVMTRVDDSPGFLSFFGSMGKWKIGMVVIVLLVCLGLVCTKDQFKKKTSRVVEQEDSTQRYETSQQGSHHQRNTDYHQQKNVY